MTQEENWYNDLLTRSGQITAVAMLIPLAMAVMRYRMLNKPARVFFWYLVVVLLVNFIEQLFIWAVNAYTDFWLPYLDYWKIGDTNFLGILAFLSNFLFLGWYYRLIIVPADIGKWVQRISIFLAMFALVDYFWITGYNAAGVFVPVLNGLFTTVVPMAQLWFLIRQDHKVGLYKIPYFWFSTGLIVSHLFSLLFFFTGEKLYETDFSLFVKLSVAGNCLRLLVQLLYAYGFYKARALKYLTV
jgi:hypothetical protein